MLQNMVSGFGLYNVRLYDYVLMLILG